jgi:hypothetical protein
MPDLPEVPDGQNGQRMPGQSEHPTSSPSASGRETADADHTLATPDALDGLAAPRLTPRQRLRRAALAAAAVLLALIVLLGGFPGPRSGVAALLVGPTPTPTLPIPPGDDLYYVDTSLPGMRVTLDGRTVPPGSLGARHPLRLARGRHRVGWRAGPFMPQSCVVTVPSAAGADDTCPRRAALAATGTAGAELPFTRFLLLHEALGTLPRDRQLALLAELQRAVADLSATVQPGDVYVADTRGVRPRPTPPLRATLRLHLILDTGQTVRPLPGCNFTRAGSGPPPCTAEFSLDDCAALCVLPFSASASLAGSAGSDEFLALVPAMLAWDYRTLAGQPIALEQSIGPGGSAVSPHLALFRITWDGASERWHAALLSGPALGAPILVGGWPLADDLACIPALDSYLGDGNAGQGSDVEVRFRSGLNPAEGCLVTTNKRDSQGNETTSRFLFRFGGVVAVDAGAQHEAPHLPAASEAAYAIARTLEQYPGQVFTVMPLGVFG